MDHLAPTHRTRQVSSVVANQRHAFPPIKWRRARYTWRMHIRGHRRDLFGGSRSCHHDILNHLDTRKDLLSAAGALAQSVENTT